MMDTRPKLTRMTLEDLGTTVCELVLSLKVQHEQSCSDDNDDLSGYSRPQSWDITGCSILLSERNTSDNTTNTSSGDTMA